MLFLFEIELLFKVCFKFINSISFSLIFGYNMQKNCLPLCWWANKLNVMFECLSDCNNLFQLIARRKLNILCWIYSRGVITDKLHIFHQMPNKFMLISPPLSALQLNGMRSKSNIRITQNEMGPYRISKTHQLLYFETEIELSRWKKFNLYYKFHLSKFSSKFYVC